MHNRYFLLLKAEVVEIRLPVWLGATHVKPYFNP